MGLLISESYAAELDGLLGRSVTAQRVYKGKRRAIQQLPRILIRVNAWIVTGVDTIWRYGWEQWELANGVFRARDGGLSGTADGTDFALNLDEVFNLPHGSGTQGNSVDESRPGFPPSMRLQPVGGGADGVPANQVLRMMSQIVDVGTGKIQRVFSYENGLDGQC